MVSMQVNSIMATIIILIAVPSPGCTRGKTGDAADAGARSVKNEGRGGKAMERILHWRRNSHSNERRIMSIGTARSIVHCR